MRLFLISNSSETLTGMRLAGIEGKLAMDENSVEKALDKAVKQGDIAIILMNKSLFDMCGESVKNFRKTYTCPLLIDIPDKGSVSGRDSLAGYVRETVGINI